MLGMVLSVCVSSSLSCDDAIAVCLICSILFLLFLLIWLCCYSDDYDVIEFLMAWLQVMVDDDEKVIMNLIGI